jgi:hypothetical protein
MKRFVFLVCIGMLFVGCGTKEVVKAKGKSIEMQKQDANRAWRELDNQ